ncbi:two-component system chemotaxis response regulator CheY [Thiogranum longum]|uniref:Two-component system chemotaxis response regulator CheY n=1 Tax=Thiogranum longum TaxID=1537524 RepID=A0A4R1HB42_9GAMM|nr:response regulator [Thiogranum longum]TCK18588.1 two-component system chemotaxis response regulator CheY [Thiogranum longum]
MSLLSLQQLDVLLVEPSSTQHRIIDGYLTAMGTPAIRWAQDGDTALALMQANTPDLVISTMHLPDMTGTDLVLRMREDDQLIDVAFMLISSETDIHYLEPLRQAGVIAILPKPCTQEQLRTAMYNALDFLEPEPLELENIAPEELNVLVVDDSFTSRRIILSMLEKLGVEKISEAENGKQAIGIIESQFFDLIVTDYNMPEMDGRELSTYIRSESSQQSVPVLMVTSETDKARLAGVEQSGVSAIFDKPFNVDTLRSAIQRLLS